MFAYLFSISMAQGGAICIGHLIGEKKPRAAFLMAIAQGRYAPQPFTVFAVTDPKLREIFAPAFVDRLVHQWLIRHIEPWWDKRFIDDSYWHAAIERLQTFMRQPGHRWYCKLDILSFPASTGRCCSASGATHCRACR